MSWQDYFPLLQQHFFIVQKEFDVVLKLPFFAHIESSRVLHVPFALTQGCPAH